MHPVASEPESCREQDVRVLDVPGKGRSNIRPIIPILKLHATEQDDRSQWNFEIRVNLEENPVGHALTAEIAERISDWNQICVSRTIPATHLPPNPQIPILLRSGCTLTPEPPISTKCEVE